MTLTNYLGKTVTIVIDRPLGSRHPSHPEMVYPINYGFIPDTTSGDGAEIDCYVLGVDHPLDRINVRILAVIERFDDCEDKLVGAPDGMMFNRDEIERAVHFQERYFTTSVLMWNTEGAVT